MKHSLIFILITLPLLGVAQKTYLNNRYLMERIQNNQDMLTGNSGIINTLAPAPPGVVGDSFLNTSFSEATLLLFDGERILPDYQAKYDILKDDFYLMNRNSIRVLSGSAVRNFSMTDSLSTVRRFYISGKLLKDVKGTELTGFYEVMVDGPSALLKKTNAIVKEADFHPALNVGSKDHRVIKSVTYFYCIDNVVQKLPSVKNMAIVFPQQPDAMAGFLKQNFLSLKEENDLKRLFEHYNTLAKE